MEDNKKIFENREEVGSVPQEDNVVFENSNSIVEQEQANKQLSSIEPYLIRDYYDRLDNVYLNNSKPKRTDGKRLKDHGIDSLDRLLEECIKVSNKQSKLPKSIRDLVLKYSLEAYKELQSKAKEIQKESLENNKQENDRKE